MYEIEERPDAVWIHLTGELVAGKLSPLRDILCALPQQAKRVILDFTRVKVIDTTMVGLLISTQKLLRTDGKRLVLFAVPDDIIKTLKLMRLDSRLEMAVNINQLS